MNTLNRMLLLLPGMLLLNACSTPVPVPSPFPSVPTYAKQPPQTTDFLTPYQAILSDSDKSLQQNEQQLRDYLKQPSATLKP